jgi:hypothetical protein
MLYLIGWDLTGDEHWRAQYRRYAWRAARESLLSPIWFRVAYAYQQAVFSLEPLVALEREDLNLQAAWLRAMTFYAGRMEGFAWQGLHRYTPPPRASVEPDWRKWTMRELQDGYRVPVFPNRLAWDYDTDRAAGEGETVREPGEALLAQLMVPGRPFSADQRDLLVHLVLNTDYAASFTYSLFYPIAAYWRAVKLGVLALPG